MKGPTVVQPDLNPLVDVAALPCVEEDRLTPLPGAYAKARALVYGLTFAVTGLAWAAPCLWLTMQEGEHGPPAALWWMLGGAWTAVMALWGVEERMGWPMRGFLVRERDVVYRSGWWTTQVVAVPFSRIQHSEIQQGPLGKWLGFCSLKLFTAGASGANLNIPGLPPETARNIRQLLEANQGV